MARQKMKTMTVNGEEIELPVRGKNGEVVEVRLVGRDGNAFAILGAVRKAMRRAGVSTKVREAFTKEATSGDYDKLLATASSWTEAS